MLWVALSESENPKTSARFIRRHLGKAPAMTDYDDIWDCDDIDIICSAVFLVSCSIDSNANQDTCLCAVSSTSRAELQYLMLTSTQISIRMRKPRYREQHWLDQTEQTILENKFIFNRTRTASLFQQSNDHHTRKS